MSYPSDFRYLPFSDTTNYVSKTEYYQIPATSPYEVRLNEVPEKANPSTMTIKVVTGWSGGSPVYGATMTEVSATPASGEYYPDYYTEADGDSNWNTGTIQFNSANANTTIEVTYMATGGLASVKSNHYPSWMTDRGDGSDGVFAPTSNTTLSGIKQYTTVNIPSGVTVTCTDSTCIKCQGAFVNNGTIKSEGGVGRNYYAGVAATRYAGNGCRSGDDPEDYSLAGSGHGLGGAGGGLDGGAIELPYVADYYNLLMTSGGGGGGWRYPYSSYSGGGGGGAIVVIANTINNNGTISVKGGNGINYTSDRGGSGGGGGAIGLIADTVAQGTCVVTGGTGYQNGANGTLFVKELGQ